MTIEQLLCPAVIRWESEFRKKLNESNIEMSDDEIYDAVRGFWRISENTIKNIAKIIKSVFLFCLLLKEIDIT